MSQTFKLHSRIVINRKIWEVDYKWRLHNEAGKECVGYVDWVGGIIWLDRAASREDKCHALVTCIIEIAIDNGGDLAAALLEVFKISFRANTVQAVRDANAKRRS